MPKKKYKIEAKPSKRKLTLKNKGENKSKTRAKIEALGNKIVLLSLNPSKNLSNRYSFNCQK
jgi:hypothetical protein